MRRIRAGVVSVVLSVVIGWTTACGPGAAPVAPATSPEARPARTKLLTIGDQVEPAAIVPSFLGSAQTGGALANLRYLMHDSLVGSPEYQANVAQLAVELPSLDNGTWRLNPDGTMDVVWRLRPNVKWHDGHPFTSADLVFTFRAHKDPDIASTSREMRLITAASAPDDLTFIVHWSAPYETAGVFPPGHALPRHLLEDLYQTDKNAFVGSPLFTTEFVGLGPYRLVTWELGSHVEAARFDDYYGGRPALDRIIVRFIRDPNTLVSNILAGAVDIVLSGSSNGISFDAAFEVKRRWEGTGNQVLTLNSGRVYVAEATYRPEYSRPRNGVTTLAVRKALYHAIDRPTLAEVMTQGLAMPADSYVHPLEPNRAALEPWIPQYPYDPTRSAQLFAEGGWTRGADGVLTHTGGERFELEFWAREGAGNDRVAAIIADGWKQVGAAMTIYIIPAAMRGNNEFESTRPGFLFINPGGDNWVRINKMHSREIPSAANRWIGINYGAYSNPRVDTLIDQLHATLDPRERLPLEQQLVYEHMADVAMMPLYWQVVPVLALKGVRGPRPNSQIPTSNIFEWDKE